jgi:acyl-CoA thioesterase-1
MKSKGVFMKKAKIEQRQLRRIRVQFAVSLVIGALVFALAGCDGEKSQLNEEYNNTIVCFGDSLTEGYGATKQGSPDKSKSYPAFLQEKVTPRVVNAGISGDTAEGGLDRVERDVLSKDPQIVIILLGGNDFLKLRSAKETKADLQGIINKLKDGNRKIYLASFIGDSTWETVIFGTIPNLASGQIAALLRDYKKMFADLISENRDVGFIEDIWTGVWGIYMSDPIHPNAEGYRIMAENIFKIIKPYLEANNLSVEPVAKLLKSI